MPNKRNPTVSAGPSSLCLTLGKSKSLPAEESWWLPERASGDGTCGGRNVGGGSATHKNSSPQVGVYRLSLSTTAHLFSYAYVPARQCRRKTVTAVTWPWLRFYALLFDSYCCVYTDCMDMCVYEFICPYGLYILIHYRCVEWCVVCVSICIMSIHRRVSAVVVIKRQFLFDGLWVVRSRGDINCNTSRWFRQEK